MKKTILLFFIFTIGLGLSPLSLFASHKAVESITGERLFYAFPNEKGLASLKKIKVFGK